METRSMRRSANKRESTKNVRFINRVCRKYRTSIIKRREVTYVTAPTDQPIVTFADAEEHDAIELPQQIPTQEQANQDLVAQLREAIAKLEEYKKANEELAIINRELNWKLTPVPFQPILKPNPIYIPDDQDFDPDDDFIPPKATQERTKGGKSLGTFAKKEHKKVPDNELKLDTKFATKITSSPTRYEHMVVFVYYFKNEFKFFACITPDMKDYEIPEVWMKRFMDCLSDEKRAIINFGQGFLRSVVECDCVTFGVYTAATPADKEKYINVWDEDPVYGNMKQELMGSEEFIAFYCEKKNEEKKKFEALKKANNIIWIN